MTIELQHQVVYGPMRSRRFGRSLGINLLPNDHKQCSYNCVYCQYGATERAESASYPSVDEVRQQAETEFARSHASDERPDWIMIAGNGEPTLHPRLDEAIRTVIAARDRHLRGVPIGILSNSSTCHRPQVRDTLSLLEARFMKLDAGDADTFHRIDRPSSQDAWRRMISGLYQMKSITLQSLFVTGTADNSNDAAVFHWVQAVGYLRPDAVQIYTLDRPPAEPGVLPVPWDRLRTIAALVRERTGVPAHAYPPSRPNEEQI